MSKIRIHELAKELGKNSKDIMEFLKTKNVEAANHMSTLSEEEAAMVRKGFSAKSPTEGHKKTKAAIVFRPQNSTQPIVRKKPAKPQRAAEDAKAEKKEVKGHQEHTAEKPVMGEASREDTGKEKVKSETVKKEAAAGALEAQSSHGGTVKKEEGKKTIIPKIENVLDLYPNLQTAEEKNLLLKTVVKRIEYLKTKKAIKKDSDPTDFELDIYPNVG